MFANDVDTGIKLGKRLQRSSGVMMVLSLHGFDTCQQIYEFLEEAEAHVYKPVC